MTLEPPIYYSGSQRARTCCERRQHCYPASRQIMGDPIVECVRGMFGLVVLKIGVSCDPALTVRRPLGIFEVAGKFLKSGPVDKPARLANQ